MTDPLVGAAVAHYEVLAKLGGGGMGVVYTARDVRLGRIVALKFLPPQWSHDESAKQRFLREAQAASATDHRNICTIHGIETAADGQLVIVMAHYAGETLKQKLEGGALPIEEAVEIAAQVAEGLAKAHAEGVVHRDIKPGNLMITDENVKILDFGLAKFANSLQLTLEGSTLGTVAYMSPEQSRGEDADARSDVWAAGVVLFEMITGTLPFRGAYPEAISHAIRNDSVPPVRVAGRDVPLPLSRIVERALAKNPAERLQSARELARDLRLLQGRTVPLDLLTGPVTAPALQMARPRRWWRSPAVLASAAVVALAAAAAPLWLFAPVARVPVVVAPVVNQTGYAELDAYRSALTAELIAELSDLPTLRVLPYDRELQILRRFRAAGQNAGQDISSREAIQALTANSGARVVIVPTLLYENGAWRARVEFRDATTAINAAAQDTAPVVSSLLKDTAYGLMPPLTAAVDDHFVAAGPRRASIARSLARIAGRAAPPPVRRLRTLDAAASMEQALDAYDRLEYETARRALDAAAQEDPRNPLVAAWRSRVATLMRQDEEAAEAGELAARLANGSTSGRDRLFIDAIAAESRRDFVAAEARYRDLVQGDPGNAAWLVELGAFQDRRLQTAPAIQSFAAALAVDAKLARAHLELCRLYGPARENESANAKAHGGQALTASRALGDGSGEAQALLCLADSLRVGTPADREAAMADARAALGIFEATGSTYQLPRAHYYLALVDGASGDMPAAVAAFDVSLVKAREGGNAVLQPLLLANLGVTQNQLGHRVRAAEYYRESSKAYEALGDEQRAAQIQANAAVLLIDYGSDPAGGLRDIQNALSVSRKLGDKNFEVFCLQVMAAYYRYAGQHAEAERALNQALAISRERNLEAHIAPLTLDVAKSRIETADYPAATTLLRQAIGDGKNPSAAEARLYLARAYIRLKDYPAATQSLAAVSPDIEGNASLVPLFHQISGELAYESGHLDAARSHFAEASALWIDDGPDAASVEARAYLGLLDGLSGRVDRGLAEVRQSLEHAQKMQRPAIEHRCRDFLARLVSKRST